MLMFTLVICCLNSFILPWFIDLTIQVPMQYCSLQHQILLPSTVHSTSGCCLCFGSIPSFFLELCLHWSPVAYWAPTNLGSSSFTVLSFSPYHTVHGVLKARILKRFAIRFSSGPHCIRPLHLSICLGWLHMACHSFIELDKAVIPCDRFASFLWLWFQSVCPLMPSLGAYRLSWVSLNLDLGFLFTAAPAKHSHCTLPWK